MGSIRISSSDSMFEDIKRSWWAILISVLLALGLSFAFLWFVHVCTSCMVYTSFVVFFTALFVLGAAFFMRYLDLNKHGNGKSWETPEAYLILAIVVWVIALISSVILCCTCDKIKVAIALLKCGGTFLWDNKDLFLFLILANIILLFWVGYGLIATAHVFAQAKSKWVPGRVFGKYEEDLFDFIAFCCYLFGNVWIFLIIIAGVNYVISGVVVEWYFKKNARGRGTNSFEVFCTMITFNFGTVCFGALL